jgi:hypothetical protein
VKLHGKFLNIKSRNRVSFGPKGVFAVDIHQLGEKGEIVGNGIIIHNAKIEKLSC